MIARFWRYRNWRVGELLPIFLESRTGGVRYALHPGPCWPGWAIDATTAAALTRRWNKTWCLWWRAGILVYGFGITLFVGVFYYLFATKADYSSLPMSILTFGLLVVAVVTRWQALRLLEEWQRLVRFYLPPDAPVVASGRDRLHWWQWQPVSWKLVAAFLCLSLLMFAVAVYASTPGSLAVMLSSRP